MMACAACERRRALMKKWMKISLDRAKAKFGNKYAKTKDTASTIRAEKRTD